MMHALTNMVSMPPFAVPVLVAVTVVLTVAFIVHWGLCRTAASRHAVLLAALVAVGVSPIVFLATDVGEVTPVVRLPVPKFKAQISPATAKAVSTVASAGLVERSSLSVSWPNLFWRIGLLGCLVALVRIAHGLAVARTWRRSAVPFAGEKAQTALDRLAESFEWPAPPVLVSPSTMVPMTIGVWRPVVLLPAGLVEQLNESQLLQVLLHECTHAARRDPLVGLYQRLVAALLWFHPLVHVVNRLLDEAREELCDNRVLRAASATDYTRTLLTVARSLPSPSHPLVGVTLFRSVRLLEKRVAGLLVPRRNAMTDMQNWKRLAIAALFVAGGYVLTAFAAAPTRNSGHELTHPVKFEVGAKQFHDGDTITIDEVIGTADKFEAGNMYIIKGTYRLNSEKDAMLTAYVTVDGGKVAELRVPDQQTQKMMVEQGEGRFSLIYYMWQDGWPHLSFYPNNGGSWIGTVYFGTGDTVLKRGWWEKDDKAEIPKSGAPDNALLEAQVRTRLQQLLEQLEEQKDQRLENAGGTAPKK
jgi:beta-lactamase regulating signal transducer with metallopeptidase domain